MSTIYCWDMADLQRVTPLKKTNSTLHSPEASSCQQLLRGGGGKLLLPPVTAFSGSVWSYADTHNCYELMSSAAISGTRGFTQLLSDLWL